MLCVHDDLRRDLSVPLSSRVTTSLVIEVLEWIDGLLFGLISTSSLKLTLLCLLESLRIPFGGSASNVSPSEPWIWIWTWFLQEQGKWNRRGKYKKKCPTLAPPGWPYWPGLGAGKCYQRLWLSPLELPTSSLIKKTTMEGAGRHRHSTHILLHVTTIKNISFMDRLKIAEISPLSAAR